MAIIKEPKGVDFTVNSEPWTDHELAEFSKLINKKKSELDDETKNEIEKLSKRASLTSS